MAVRVEIDSRDPVRGRVLRVNGKPTMGESAGHFHRMLGTRFAKGRVLDIGTGLGEFLKAASLNNNVTSIVTVDLHPEIQTLVAAERGNEFGMVPTYIGDDISNYILTNTGRFDFVFCDYLWRTAKELSTAVAVGKAIIAWATTHLNRGGQIAFNEDIPRWNNSLQSDLRADFNKEHKSIYGNLLSMIGTWEFDLWTIKS